MKLQLFQVDAFAERVFEGNPAAVCPLQEWLADSELQAIAAENNLSETAFFRLAGEVYELRWFTPSSEVDLCGHATLATAYVLFEHLGHLGATVHFNTRSGRLDVRRQPAGYRMDFPALRAAPCEAPAALLEGLGVRPRAVLAASDYVAVLDSAAAVQDLTPDLAALERLDRRGVVVTAAGDDCDFVSRCFFPRLGVPEDPVTGSAHCELAPYWAQQLGRNTLSARQLSRRGGRVGCEVAGERVYLEGQARLYLEGEIHLR